MSKRTPLYNTSQSNFFLSHLKPVEDQVTERVLSGELYHALWSPLTSISQTELEFNAYDNITELDRNSYPNPWRFLINTGRYGKVF